MDIDIIAIFDRVLEESRSIDIAESEFKRLAYDDEELLRAYRKWCSENEVSERHGFIQYCNARLDEEESYWDTLTDYDE